MADMAKKHSDAYEKIGEAVLFAELAAGQPNFKCVLTNGICQPMPSCKEIVKFIKSEAGEPTSHCRCWGEPISYFGLFHDFLLDNVHSRNILYRAITNSPAT
jgi:hypothetical protein